MVPTREGAGRQMSGSRMSESTWYGPLKSKPKSPWNSPWSVVKITSVSSHHPRSLKRPTMRPIASSMSSFSICTIAFTSRTWSAVKVLGTHWAGASKFETNSPLYQASHCAGFVLKMRSRSAGSLMYPAGRSRSRQFTRCSSDMGGSHA